MRETTKGISEKRAGQKSTFFITGITSFLGSHIAVELLKKKYPVIALCRSKYDLSAAERIQQRFQWLNFKGDSGLKIIEGELSKPRFGLAPHEYHYLVENVNEILHCGANTSFKNEDKEKVESVNIEGTNEVLKLAIESNCYFFHYMSTAFVVGKTERECLEEYSSQLEFNNPYERSKHIAEGKILAACKENGIRINIFRPSIVYGHSKTGRSMLFNALYFPLRTLAYLKNVYERDIDRNNGKLAEKVGVVRTRTGKLHLPIRFDKVDNSVVNLIPIDYLTDACMAIIESNFENRVFNITAKKSRSAQEIYEWMERFLNIEGLCAVPPEDYERQPKTALEKIFESYMDVYKPYVFDTKQFNNENTDKILRAKNIEFPELDYSIFEKCMNYAMEVNWGKKIFNFPPPVSEKVPEYATAQ